MFGGRKQMCKRLKEKNWGVKKMASGCRNQHGVKKEMLGVKKKGRVRKKRLGVKKKGAHIYIYICMILQGYHTHPKCPYSQVSSVAPHGA